MVRVIGRVGRVCLETVFPTTCPACGASIAAGPDPLWCEACAPRILWAAGREYCRLCGRDTGPYELHDGRCTECRSRQAPLSGLVRVGPHQDALRRMVLDFKYKRAPLDRTLGRLVEAAIRGAPWCRRLDAVVPVPTHWRRRLERGHSPPAALARAVEKVLDVPMAEVLRRTRYDPPQVGLSKNQRKDNVRGAFAVVGRSRLQGLTVCVIDDVTTTGATLWEASRSLLKADVRHVYAAVIAKSESTRRI